MLPCRRFAFGCPRGLRMAPGGPKRAPWRPRGQPKAKRGSSQRRFFTKEAQIRASERIPTHTAELSASPLTRAAGVAPVMELAAAPLAAWSDGGARSVQGDKHNDRLAQTVCSSCMDVCERTICYKLFRPTTKGADRWYFMCRRCENLRHRISRLLHRADSVISVAWPMVHPTKRDAVYKDAKDMYGEALEARIAAAIEHDIEGIMAKLTGAMDIAKRRGEAGLPIKVTRLWRWLEMENSFMGESSECSLSPERAADLLYMRVTMRNRFIEHPRSCRRPSRSRSRKRHGAKI